MAKNGKQKQDGIIAEIITITPTMAKGWLGNNPENRNIRQKLANRYARDMFSGEWTLNGEPIIFDSGGSLLDGQHRLTACIVANKSFKSLVVRGVPRTRGRFTIDTGKSKTAGDYFGMMGYAHSTNLASCLNWIWKIRHGKSTAQNIECSQQELQYMLGSNPSIEASVAFIGSKNSLIRSGMFSALHWLMSQADADFAELFFSGLRDGTGLSEGEPVLVLRRRLEKEKINKNFKLRAWVRAALVIKAWNAFIFSKPMKRLAWYDAKGEQFPEIRAPK